MYYNRDDEKPIIDNLLRAYRAPREGAPRPDGPDFDALIERIRAKWAGRRNDGTTGGQGA